MIRLIIQNWVNHPAVLLDSELLINPKNIVAIENRPSNTLDGTSDNYVMIHLLGGREFRCKHTIPELLLLINGDGLAPSVSDLNL